MTGTVQNEQFRPFSARPGGNGSIDCHFRPGRAEMDLLTAFSARPGRKWTGPKMDEIFFIVLDCSWASMKCKSFQILKIEWPKPELYIFNQKWMNFFYCFRLFLSVYKLQIFSNFENRMTQTWVIYILPNFFYCLRMFLFSFSHYYIARLILL